MNKRPYISFVVAARNDNYGGDFLHRFQIFLNVFGDLSEEYKLDAELIIVEWNPPDHRESIYDALSWPSDLNKIRIIKVPEKIHSQLPNSDRMPMFEYLAKNVGIRHAEGEYILATNPDIVFSKELFHFLSTHKLSQDCFYRVNRYDVNYRIPDKMPVEKQLKMCHEYAFRVNLKEDTVLLTSGVASTVKLSNTTGSQVHTNAAGDFFLMSGKNWHRLRGYPELKSHSFVDGYICYMALSAGLRQVILSEPIYHQEHDRSEHAKRPFTDYQKYEDDCREMLKNRKPMVINDENWGLMGEDLHEFVVAPNNTESTIGNSVTGNIEDYLMGDPENGKIVLPRETQRIWIDVGAHEGETTLSALDEKEDLAIIAFEPIIEKCRSLNKKHPRMFAIPAAVSEQEGYANFHLTENRVSSSLRLFNPDGLAIWKDKTGLEVIEERIVPTIRLDTLLERLPLDHIEYLKVDAQGHDFEVIKSAGKQIDRVDKVKLEVTVTPVQVYEGAANKYEIISYMLRNSFGLVEVESQTDGQEENLTFLNLINENISAPLHEMTERKYCAGPGFTPARAYWEQRFKLASLRDRILSLAGAVDNKTDLWPFQWAQLMAAALEFKPDLILELGRGKGNSTCAFTEVANQLRDEGIDCNVVSLCISDDWEDVTQWRVLQVVDEGWFRPLKALKGNILTFDYRVLLKGVKKCLLFWDAHGFDVAECVLGNILPMIAGKPNLVIMHDLSDARYLSSENSSYGNNRLWRGNNWTGQRVRLGYIDSAVEQAVNIVDFTSRNSISLDSADHSFDIGIAEDAAKLKDMQDVLGSDLFNLGAHWFWFTLNGVYRVSYPKFTGAISNNFYEINILEGVQILGVSLKDAVVAQPYLKDIILRVNRYLNVGQINLAVKMIDIELGHLEASVEILRRLREFVLKVQKDDAQQFYRLPETMQILPTL